MISFNKKFVIDIEEKLAAVGKSKASVSRELGRDSSYLRKALGRGHMDNDDFLAMCGIAGIKINPGLAHTDTAAVVAEVLLREVGDTGLEDIPTEQLIDEINRRTICGIYGQGDELVIATNK